MFRHIVLFRVRDEVTDPEVFAAVDAIRSLGAISGATAWHAALSLDERKGRVVVEDATFASHEEFQAFRQLPTHAEVVARMAQISDWWVGDYDDPSSRSSRNSHPGQSG